MDTTSLINTARQQVANRVDKRINLDDIVHVSKNEIQAMAEEKVNTAMEMAILGAQSVLKTTSDKYINALYIKDDLTIGLRDSVSYLEDGYPAREMLQSLTTGLKSKMAKDGSRYTVIPIGGQLDFEGMRPQSKRGKTSDSGFKVASSKQDPSMDWIHPGFEGVHQLEFINEQLTVDLQEGAVRILEDAISSRLQESARGT